MKYKILPSSFLGKPIQKDLHYHIIGAGIAGLLVGYQLKKANISFEIHEISQRAGGLLGTQEHPKGFSEQSANGFIYSPEIQQLCQEIDLKILAPSEASKARYLVRNNKLRRFPLSIGETLASLPKFMLPHSKDLETIHDFGSTYLGNAMTNQVLEPAFAGIYGADIRQLSFPGALTVLAEKLNHSQSLPLAILKTRKKQKTKAKRGTHSFEGGMGALTKRLAEILAPHIHYQSDGSQIKAEQTILCVPAYVAKNFLADEEIKSMLSRVKYTPIISSTFFFRKEQLANFKEGFGCLIPRSEGRTILGVLFNSCIFPSRVKNDELLSLTAILRDDSSELNLFKKLDIDLKNFILNDLDKLFQIEGHPIDYALYRWPKGIPLYSPELYQNWFKIDARLKEQKIPINLFGNYTGEISIRGMIKEAASIVS